MDVSSSILVEWSHPWYWAFLQPTAVPTVDRREWLRLRSFPPLVRQSVELNRLNRLTRQNKGWLIHPDQASFRFRRLTIR